MQPMRALQSLFARCLALVLAVTLSIQPALAQSILRDAETESLLHEMATPLIRAAGLDPRNVSVVLVGDMSINAFVAGGQVVYLNAGLINEAGSALEVQGVIAHELGHITGGHIINEGGANEAQGISILSLLLGGIAAAAGSGDAAMGVIMAGQQAALGKYLAFSRGQEASADAAGAKYLSAAGLSGRGSLQFFKRLANLEMRYGFTRTPDSEFYRTHPMTMDRITTLQDTYEKDPAWNKPNDPRLEARFLRVKAKLLGYLAEPQLTMQVYPPSENDVPAHYARAYAWHKEAYLDKAMAETDALLAKAPGDPYFLELKPDPARNRQTCRSARHPAPGNRAIGQPAAHRHDLWPCADRDRESQELYRGGTGPQERGRTGSGKSLRLVPTGRGLCRQRRYGPGPSGQRGTAGDELANAASLAQRGSGRGAASQRNTRLASRPGYCHAGAGRD